MPVPDRHRSSVVSFVNSSGNERLRSAGVKEIDVATLGNLCVDIVLNVPQLPPSSLEDRKVYMEQLSASPPDKVCFFFDTLFCC